MNKRGWMIILLPLLCLVMQGLAKGHGGQFRGPIPTSTGGPGDITISPSSTFSNISWEEWWARNRYRFLNFPGIRDQASELFPTTPRAGAGPSRTDPLGSFKKEVILNLRPFMKHSSFRLRSSSVLGLGMLNDVESLQEMIDTLKDGNQVVRDTALIALGFMESTRARHLLFHFARGTPIASKALGQSSVPDYCRCLAQLSLSLNRAAGIEPVLMSLAIDPTLSPDVRALALEGIGLMGGEESAKFLIDISLDKKTDPDLVSAAVSAMGKTRTSMVHPILVKHLYGKHREVRQSAAVGLGLAAPREDPISVDQLYRSSRHSTDQALRGYCLISMGLIGGPQAVDRLTQSCQRGQNSTCPWAYLGLGLALRDAKHLEGEKILIKQLTTNANRSFRGAAAIALGLAGSKEALDPLILMLEEGDDPYFRGYCALALGMIQDEIARPCLLEAIQENGQPQVITQAAMALALMNEREAGPELIDRLLQVPDFNLKAYLAFSLGFMADLTLLQSLMEILDDGYQEMDDQTLANCILVVSRILSSRSVPFFEPMAANSNFASEIATVKVILSYGI